MQDAGKSPRKFPSEVSLGARLFGRPNAVIVRIGKTPARHFVAAVLDEPGEMFVCHLEYAHARTRAPRPRRVCHQALPGRPRRDLRESRSRRAWGDPRMKWPAGTTTISGQVEQSLNRVGSESVWAWTGTASRIHAAMVRAAFTETAISRYDSRRGRPLPRGRPTLMYPLDRRPRRPRSCAGYVA